MTFQNKKRKVTILFIALVSLLNISPIWSQSSSWYDTAHALQQAFRSVSSDVLPVVVEIDVTQYVERRNTQFTMEQFFFGTPFSQPQNEGQTPETETYEQQSLGSGVIVEQRGKMVYILTNNHVVGNADEISITLYDGRTYEAELVGTDPNKDLALISIETSERIPVAALGNSDDLQVGDWVLAIGNPMGFESTVTQGIISAKSRREGPDNRGFTDYIQTDAAINQGNSGGALVNLEGEVVGINTWIVSQSGGSIGLGFAIPINNAKKAIDDFITKGNVEYGWLGVYMGTLSESLAESMDLTGKEGAFVFNIYQDSPAMEGGLQPGDLITSVDGKLIETSNDLINTIANDSPGKRVEVTYIRGEREYEATITLGLRKDLTAEGTKITLWPGFTVAELTADMREQMGLSRNAGNLIIGSVDESSKAAALGLQNGDIIKSINRRGLKDMKDFYEAVNSSNDLEIRVNRRGYEFDYNLSLR
ncbi:MAG: Do family serine endopeptidase [Spirochaetales bacterium]|nr:Do family serine endopeptidase [Spirochaetales bacterium]